MRVIGIIANGPADHLPNLKLFDSEIDTWIGVDRGTLQLVNHEIKVNYAIGDFDSVDQRQKELIKDKTVFIDEHPAEKNATDLEIAIQKAIELDPEKIYLFGVTGGRLDHTLINIQLLYTILYEKICGKIIDKWNVIELTNPGNYEVNYSKDYPYISFIPYTKQVQKLSLKGFYYPLTNYTLDRGSTRCISNKLSSEKGRFSYVNGMLLMIKSRDVI